jgi:hypothetical protein
MKKGSQSSHKSQKKKSSYDDSGSDYSDNEEQLQQSKRKPHNNSDEEEENSQPSQQSQGGKKKKRSFTVDPIETIPEEWSTNTDVRKGKIDPKDGYLENENFPQHLRKEIRKRSPNVSKIEIFELFLTKPILESLAIPPTAEKVAERRTYQVQRKKQLEKFKQKKMKVERSISYEEAMELVEEELERKKANKRAMSDGNFFSLL